MRLSKVLQFLLSLNLDPAHNPYAPKPKYSEEEHLFAKKLVVV